MNNPTILDAGGQGRVIYIVKNNIQPTIRGLELTGGDAAGLQGEPLGDGHVGGGIYIMAASPIIENCQIRDNTAGAGGGLYFTAWDMWEAHKYLSKRNQVL